MTCLFIATSSSLTSKGSWLSCYRRSTLSSQVMTNWKVSPLSHVTVSVYQADRQATLLWGFTKQIQWSTFYISYFFFEGGLSFLSRGCFQVTDTYDRSSAYGKEELHSTWDYRTLPQLHQEWLVINKLVINLGVWILTLEIQKVCSFFSFLVSLWYWSTSSSSFWTQRSSLSTSSFILESRHIVSFGRC